MKAKVTSPDGKQHIMSADNEEALHHAIQQMHGGQPQTIDVASLDKPKAPGKVSMKIDVDMPNVLEVLERIANRPDPELPEPPPPPEPPEKIDFAPVIEAIKRLERDEPPPVDLTPMHAHADQMRSQMDSLVAAVESQSEAMDSLRKDLLAALERVCAAVTAPRELVRDGDGRPVRSVVDEN